jgi:hypothetical protein
MGKCGSSQALPVSGRFGGEPFRVGSGIWHSRLACDYDILVHLCRGTARPTINYRVNNL